MSRTLVRVFLLVLVLVAGVSSFSPEASAQLMGATFWKQNNLLASDVVTASLTNTSASQTVTVETANSPPWTHIRIVACNRTSVEPSTKIFTNAAFNSQPTGCRIINTGSTTVATTLDSTFTVTATEISNGGVVVLMAAVGVTYTRFFYSEWVPILVPAIEVDPSTALNLTEEGATGTYNVKLRTQPSGGVKVRVVSGNTAVTVNAGATADTDFTTTNWNTTQAVTVTAVNDTNLIDETVTLTFSTVNASTSADYDNVTDVTRTVNVYDNDRSPGIVTSAVSGSATEAGGQATFTVKLNTRPSTNLSTTVGIQDGTEGVVSPTFFNWDSSNWNTERTVTVTGANDDVDDGDQTYNIRIYHGSGAPEYLSITKDVSVTTEDDDVAGITTGAVTGSLTEAGGTVTFTVVLDSEPTANVTIAVSSGDPTEGTVLPSSLTFTAGNWNTSKPVTVTGVDDDVNDGPVAYDITLTPSSTDTIYNNLSPVTVRVTTPDDDGPPTVMLALSSTAITENGGVATVTATLSGKSSQAVTLTVTTTPAIADDFAKSGTTLTIAAEQTTSTGLVTVTAVDNDVAAADKEVTISATATGGNNVDSPTNVTLTITDDDTPGLVIAPTALALEEATTTPATHMKTYTVKLATEPTAAVTVTVGNDDPGAVTVAPTTLPFTTTNWATAQTVTVTAVVDEGDYRNEAVTLTHTASTASGASEYDTLPAAERPSVTVTVADKDTPPTLGPGEDTTINGHPVTVTSVGEPLAVTVTPPADLNGAITVEITPAGEPPENVKASDSTEGSEPVSRRFSLGSEVTHRTVVDIAVSGAGLATVQTAGLEICLPVSAELRAEARALGRALKILHYQNDAWTVVENPADRDGRLCATVTTFSPFAVGYQDMTPGFAADAGRERTYYTGTAARADAVDLPAATGGEGRITYTLTPALPAGLTYTPPTAGAKHGGTITGTPTTRTAEQTYTLTATDMDGDTGSLTFPLEVKPFTLTKDMADPPRTVNGYTVTVVRKSGTPGAVTVEPPRTLAGNLEVVIQPVAATGPRESRRFTLGADVTVDIAVSGAGLATVQTAGLEICLPVRDVLRAEARALGRALQFLHYQNDAWTVVENSADRGGLLCATVTEFAPFAVGYRDEKPRFPGDMESLPLLVHTGRAVSENLPAVVSGDEPISYTLTPATLPAGLTYTYPGDKLGSEYDGTITGTPTTPTPEEQPYTLTATDEDGDTKSITLTIEVKPGIQSRDLALVLAGVGRTLASDAVEILGSRFGSSPASRLQVTLGGQVLRLTTPPASPSPSSSPPSPLAGEARGEGGGLRGESSVLQSEAQESSARPAGAGSPWQQATGLALSVARALGVTLDNSPSPLAGAGRGEGEGLQNEASLLGRLPTDLRRAPTSSPLRRQTVSGKDLLARSAFELPLTRTGDAGVPAWTLWGRGSAAGFSGQPEAGFTMDGTLYSGYVGVDYRPQATVLMGLALAHSTGEVNYERTGATKAGADVELTSVLPYAHWQPRPGLGVWGLAGVGWGEMDLKLVGDPQTYTTGLTSWLGAVGGRQALTTWQGIDLAAKTDAFMTTVRSAGKTNLPAARGHAQRVRLLVEGRTAVEVSSVSRLEPRLELGGRWDNGTAEQGLGAELGGGVAYTRTDWGLSVDAQGRYLLLHEDGAFEDWGASMSVRLDPGVAGEGAYLTVAPVWGQASSGVEQLWGTAAVLPQASGTSQPATGWQPHRLEVDLGYGLALADGRGLVTPYGGLALAGPGSSRYRLGSRLALSSSLDVTLEGERAEQSGQKTAHGVSIRLGWQW